MLTALSLLALLSAAIPCSLFLGNLLLYRRPSASPFGAHAHISVLIPARNEEARIEHALEAVLRSVGPAIEAIVMDDASTDGTARIVRSIAARDARVRLLQAPPLPVGWNGKQHACWALAHAASHDVLCFLDADVVLAPEAVLRMASFLHQSQAALVSGFPRQLTETTLEWLLLPLIHFVLLGLLPIAGMRRSTAPSFAAGCGQFLMVRRDAYFQCGGHAAIRETMHDGLRLPAQLRSFGMRTDLADLTTLATCRMYRSAGEVWAGLGKNATEGLAAPGRILPLTLLLGMGQVLPLLLLLYLCLQPEQIRAPLLICIVTAIAATLLPRLLAAWRFQQRLRSALLHPLGISLLLLLQWSALLRKLRGGSVTWRDRSYTAADAIVHEAAGSEPL